METRSLQLYHCFFFVLILLTAWRETSGAADAACNGSIAECDAGGEALMESGISQKFVEEQKTRYISAGALKRDQPVCKGGGGEAYSRSCLPPPSNPHSRGCYKYYRCRDDS
ncbi:protein RALF-like 32 [Malania oleifera]|uniref:protein RALF-like 32 n=1 Tax=Malania oleifera TaxID=397392 RepID=UPI0025AE018B|nr:protein RALF-like 32 [Malania oleifera]